MLLYHSLAVALPLLTLTTAQTSAAIDANLVGTWSSKSNQTLTGPGFYDPLNDQFIEPSRTGISYSFTSDGHFEEAYYRAISNPQDPACPGGIMQWQHGSYTVNANGSLSLEPIPVDGRQLLSKPCDYDKGVYTRYNQTEFFKSYEVLLDPYHNIQRLNLFQFDGSPLQPMYLVYSPPQMLPTTTLNPTSTSTAGAAATGSSKQKRGLGRETALKLNLGLEDKQTMEIVHRINADRLWWFGLTLTGLGGLLYFGPRRLGLRL